MNREEPVWTVLRMLEWATGYFTKKGVPDPRLSIEWIISDVLNSKRLDLYLQFDRPLSPDELECIRPMVKRRALCEPLQYITGKTDFFGASIHVTPDVLIPRQETEQLVQILFDNYQQRSKDTLSLLDLGTGSGCIPIAIKQQFPHWNCYGADISPEALSVATTNAEHNKVDVTFFKTDLTRWQDDPQLLDSNIDIIISNPPYITPSEKKEMHSQVIDFEPELALFHKTPLLLYKEVIRFAENKNASLYLECNHKTALEVKHFAETLFEHVDLIKDLDNNPRFIITRPS